MDLSKSLNISAAGMRAQGTRLRVISENIANADSTAQAPGAAPYRRKVVSFGQSFDRELGLSTVHVAGIHSDRSDFKRSFQPNHPAADENGYVLMPNVNTLLEMADMREAQRSYEANLKMIQTSQALLQRTIDILR